MSTTTNALTAPALAAVNEAATQIRARHPFPRPLTVAELPEPESTAWLRTQQQLITEALAMNDLDAVVLTRIPRAWVDVQLTDGRWVGRWTEHSITEAALSTACWFDQPITAAGVGLKQTTTDADHLQARIDGGELLALLGDTW